MDADPKTYAACFPSPSGRSRDLATVPGRDSEETTNSWNDPPLDPSWTRPDATLAGKIESAQGMLTERFAFCQTMPLEEFLTAAEALRKSGYRPTRFRPYAEGKTRRVAAVWTRDGRTWRIAHDQTAEEIRQTGRAEQARRDILPFDVAGYLATGEEERQAHRPLRCPLGRENLHQMTTLEWSWRHATTEFTAGQDQLKNAGLVPLTVHACGKRMTS